MAGYRAKRFEHARVLDVPLGQVPLDHPVASRGRRVGRVGRNVLGLLRPTTILPPRRGRPVSSPRPATSRQHTTPVKMLLTMTISLHSMIAAGSSLAQGLAARHIILHRTRWYRHAGSIAVAIPGAFSILGGKRNPFAVDEVPASHSLGFDLAAEHEHR